MVVLVDQVVALGMGVAAEHRRVVLQYPGKALPAEITPALL
jgi:hypothetical protein